MKDERFPRSARIRSGREIRWLLRKGRRCRLGPIDAFIAQAAETGPRFGLIVPRHGHSAAARNRLQRRLREIARRDWLPAARTRERGLDVLVRARREAYGRSYEELRALITEAVERPCEA
ncbi:MAG: ribonuclease P protein component [Gemmatimonadota bacterium]|nr:MAG: ribonuclease P protein component [Gemmatimonadota bacterium]